VPLAVPAPWEGTLSVVLIGVGWLLLCLGAPRLTPRLVRPALAVSALVATAASVALVLRSPFLAASAPWTIIPVALILAALALGLAGRGGADRLSLAVAAGLLACAAAAQANAAYEFLQGAGTVSGLRPVDLANYARWTTVSVCALATLGAAWRLARR